MNLHELAPVMGSTHVNKRKGRGSATGSFGRQAPHRL